MTTTATPTANTRAAAINAPAEANAPRDAAAPAGAARDAGGRRLTIVAAALVCLMTAALLLFYGAGEDGLRSVIRNTARTSFALFVAGFAAPALARLRPARLTLRLADAQPHLFAAFAASHLVHAAAIFTLAWQTRGASLEDRGAAVIIAGGLVYLCILAAALPASARAARWLATRPRARAARTFGLYLVWLTFADSYGGRAVGSLFYVPFALVLLAALALRLLAAVKRRADAAPHTACADAPAAWK